MWKNKLKFTFYVRLCMRIPLAYYWLFTLLLILINIFQINFLLSIFSFYLTPWPKPGEKTKPRHFAPWTLDWVELRNCTNDLGSGLAWAMACYTASVSRS